MMGEEAAGSIYAVVIIIGIVLLVAGVWQLFTAGSLAAVILMGIGLLVIGIGGSGPFGKSVLKVGALVGILLIIIGVLIEYIL